MRPLIVKNEYLLEIIGKSTRLFQVFFKNIAENIDHSYVRSSPFPAKHQKSVKAVFSALSSLRQSAFFHAEKRVSARLF